MIEQNGFSAVGGEGGMGADSRGHVKVCRHTESMNADKELCMRIMVWRFLWWVSFVLGREPRVSVSGLWVWGVEALLFGGADVVFHDRKDDDITRNGGS